jgi:putative heme-binding domain-containing protein
MNNAFRSCLIVAASVVFPASTLFAAQKPVKLMDEPAILKSMKWPKDFDVTVFAMPPDVMYPTAVSATGNGDVYVAIDEDGSLGKDPGKGRVVKCIDTNGDGKADKFITFARMDHPRGLYFDTSTDTLYVLHPPFIHAYRDTNGDGVSDTTETIATGIANEKAQAARGADHTTNSFRVGIDGWMYIAQGDFGSIKATGKDGTEMVRHGGGVTRIRLDGSGLEMYSTGERNICDVAVDPLLNVFTRDNTNDGDGWDVRLSYIVPSGYYGYPSKFKHFKGEFIEPLADYGGGSPVGSLFLSEPNYPGDMGHSLYTVEWGASAIFRHPLEPQGAGFKNKLKQEQFMKVQRAIDMDADAIGHLYVASWINGGFSYSGPNVGFVARVTPKDHQPATFPDLRKMDDAQLTQLIASPSAVTRQSVQREIIKRGATNSAPFAKALITIASSKDPLPVRVAAIFTLKQLLHDKSNDALIALTKNDELREFALRALCDVKNDPTVPAGPFIEGLSDPNPRVRLIAAFGLARINKPDAAAQIVPLLGDPDPYISHVAENAMVTLKASAAALKAIDPATPKLVTGAVHVLQSLHETQVVDGLTDKLKTIEDPAIRTQIYGAICRLHYREADWDGSWWNTRPDTTGPYYKTAEWDGTAKVQSVLKSALTSEKPEVVKELVILMQKNKVEFPELTATLEKLAAQDPSFKSVLIDLAANKQRLGTDQITLLQSVASSEKEPVATRAKALRVLQKNANKPAVLDASVAALGVIAAAPNKDKELASAYTEFVRDAKLVNQISYFTKLADSPDAAKRDTAFEVLTSLANNKLLQRDRKAAPLAGIIQKAWKSPTQTPSLLRAIGKLKIDAYAAQVKAAEGSTNPQIASAARTAAEQLGLMQPTTSGGALIEKLTYENAVATATKTKGDAAVGKELFTKLGCVQCHTTTPEEAPKGPFLGGISTRYNRTELCESILKPSAKISQGFETQWFKTKDDEDYEGFVTRDAGDEIEIRNILGATSTIKKSDIKERGRRNLSVMPEGLLAKQSPQDLASILAFLESLKGK